VFLAVTVLAAGAVAAGSTSHGPAKIQSCYSKRTGILRVINRGKALPKRCSRAEGRLTWNKVGPPGPSGSAGGATAWAAVTRDGQLLAGSDTILSVDQVDVGEYCVNTRVPVSAAIVSPAEGQRVAWAYTDKTTFNATQHVSACRTDFGALVIVDKQSEGVAEIDSPFSIVLY
jgi:hypothetical protein